LYHVVSNIIIYMAIMKYKKLIILCKGNSVTGGSELVHQLCHELDNLNLRSYVCYYPFHINYETPNQSMININKWIRDND